MVALTLTPSWRRNDIALLAGEGEFRGRRADVPQNVSVGFGTNPKWD